jgi:ABC-2 type transport system ATP-binding protein
LEKKDWIFSIKKHDSKLTLGVEKGDEKIPKIVEISQSQVIKIKSINVRKPTLDDVFLYFTGKSIRDRDKKNDVVSNPRFRLRGKRR